MRALSRIKNKRKIVQFQAALDNDVRAISLQRFKLITLYHRLRQQHVAEMPVTPHNLLMFREILINLFFIDMVKVFI